MLVNREKLVALVRERNENRQHKLCLFLGAGADIASGGLTFTELKRRCYERMTKNPFVEGMSERKVDSFFEDIFTQYLAKDERSRLIEKYFRDAGALEPSEGYSILALLLRIGGVDAVVTTNFDVMLETAADRLGGHGFEVFSPGARHPVSVNGSFLHSSRPPYVKVHGDFETRIVTVITTQEIEHGEYEPEIEGMIREIFSTHHVVFAGYSGWDAKLAAIIGECVDDAENQIYWCNPSKPSSDAPLMKALSSNVQYVQAGFDECIAILAEDRLKQGDLSLQSSSFLLSVFHWRINHQRSNFGWPIKLGAKTGGLSSDNGTYIRRKNAEASVRKFLSSHKNIAAIVAPSGYGKTTLSWKVSKEMDEQNGKLRVLPITAKSLTSNDLEAELMKRCAPAAADLGVTALDRWLTEKGIQLCIIIDGINEYSANINECVMLFRNIVRMGFALREGAMLRIIATMRHETWSHVQGGLDPVQLSAVMWSSQDDIAASVKPVVLDRYSLDELDYALRALHADKHDVLWASNIPATVRQLLRDPFLLHIVLQAEAPKKMLLSPDKLFESYIEGKLSGLGSYYTRLATEALAQLAALCQSRGSTSFRALDISDCCSRNDSVENLILDSGLINEERNSFYKFVHDRIEEFFLAKAINAHLPGVPCIDNLVDVIDLIKSCEGTPILFGAVRRHILSKPDLFLKLLLGQGSQQIEVHMIAGSSVEAFRAFAKEMLLEAAVTIPKHLLLYAETVVESWPERVTSAQVSSALQAAALLGPEKAAPIFESAMGLKKIELANEAWVYFTDRVTDLVFDSGFDLEKEPFISYIYGDSKKAWQPLQRVLGLLSALGPDNLDSSRYEQFTHAVRGVMGRCMEGLQLDAKDLLSIKNDIVTNLDRYAFNMTLAEFESFFANPRRDILVQVLNRLRQGNSLKRGDIASMREFTFAEKYHAEFLLLNILFSLSALNDFDATLRVWRDHVDGFSGNTHPEEIDFFTGVVAYIFIVANKPYDGSLDGLTRRLPRDLPQAFYHSPGLRRGMARGFNDLFDMVFEDGFNPIAGYPLVAPSAIPFQLRNRIRLGATLEENDRLLVLPVMQAMLNDLLRQQEFDKVIRVIHALGQTLCVWPREALLAMEPLCGIQDRGVRKALVRVLTEAFARRPLETRLFLDSVRGSLTTSELNQIRLSEVNSVGCRQFETVEWARIIHFILAGSSGTPDTVYDTIEALLTAGSLSQAIKEIACILRVYSGTRNR